MGTAVRPAKTSPGPRRVWPSWRSGAFVCFCGMQWQAIGLLCDIPFSKLYGLFNRWTGSAFGAVCSAGCAVAGGSLAVMPRNQAPWSSIVDRVVRRRVALTVVSTAE
jgi:hypothetical protein